MKLHAPIVVTVIRHLPDGRVDASSLVHDDAEVIIQTINETLYGHPRTVLVIQHYEAPGTAALIPDPTLFRLMGNDVPLPPFGEHRV